MFPDEFHQSGLGRSEKNRYPGSSNVEVKCPVLHCQGSFRPDLNIILKPNATSATGRK